MPRPKKSQPTPSFQRTIEDAAMDPASRERLRLAFESILAPFRSDDSRNSLEIQGAVCRSQ